MTVTNRTPAILAVGMCSALGTTFGEATRRYASGGRGIRKKHDLVGADSLPPTVANAISIPECHDYSGRLVALFEKALEDVSIQLGDKINKAAFRVLMGLHIYLPDTLETFRDKLRCDHHKSIGSLDLSIGGAAEALSELGFAVKSVRDGEIDFILVGAIDSFMHPAILDELAYKQRLLSQTNPWGIVPGEAAVLMAIGLKTPGRPHVGELLGVFRGQEIEDPFDRQGFLGRGLAGAFARGADFEHCERLIVDLNGERWRAEEFGVAVSRATSSRYGAAIGALAVDPEAPALHFGDCGTATGLLMPALGLAGPPPGVTAGGIACIASSSADSGLRAVGFVEPSGP